MIIKLIAEAGPLISLLNDRKVTGNIVDPGDHYAIKPDALYLGVYDGETLAGVHEVRQFWQNVVECHAIYAREYRGRKALEGHRLFCRWLLKNNPFTNSVTMVPDTTPYGRSIITLLGATRIGRMDAAYFSKGEPVGVTLYQLTRQQYEDLANDHTR